MLRSNLSRAVRYLRRRRGWRQSDLAAQCGVSRQVISRIERGELGGQTLRAVGRVIDALDASGELVVRWQGEQLDRLFDADHARLTQSAAALLESAGWLTKLEVSFNHYGDRGRVDLLALHGSRRVLLVTEVKSAIGDIQDLLGRLDVKVRLAGVLAASVGWDRPDGVVAALVIADSRTARRIVQRHDPLFRRFSLRGRRAVAWLRRPFGSPPSGVLWYVNLPDSRGAAVTRSARVRIDRSRR